MTTIIKFQNNGGSIMMEKAGYIARYGRKKPSFGLESLRIPSGLAFGLEIRRKRLF
jgi:hypothetical protein